MERKIGINTDCLRGQLDEVSTLKLAKDFGFESMTTGKIDIRGVSELKETADMLGIDFPFLHAPFGGINNMWLDNDEGFRKIYEGMTEAIDSASACEVPAVIIHVSSGWNAPPVNDLGLSRFDALVDYAAGKNVTVAFENLRMVGNLSYLKDRYENNPFVRYCYDCGHAHCYTNPVEWLDIFTDKLIATHIHDNMSRPLGDKSTDPDLHWLPFDGTFNYHEMMRKMDKYGYDGVLMLEVFRGARDDYKKLSSEAFLATAYDRIVRISKI
jgi:sugar phosphate isomerase/epimerase